MFPVEISVPDEEKLAEIMETMRTWLDHKKFEPATFRYSGGSKVIFRVDFLSQDEAAAFAREFSGEVVIS